MCLYYIHPFYFVSILILMAHSSLSVQSLKNLENKQKKKTAEILVQIHCY